MPRLTQTCAELEARANELERNLARIPDADAREDAEGEVDDLRRRARERDCV